MEQPKSIDHLIKSFDPCENHIDKLILFEIANRQDKGIDADEMGDDVDDYSSCDSEEKLYNNYRVNKVEPTTVENINDDQPLNSKI